MQTNLPSKGFCAIFYPFLPKNKQQKLLLLGVYKTDAFLVEMLAGFPTSY